MSAINCPTGCVADLPPVEYDKCNPTIVLSEIQRIFIAKSVASPFTNVDQATEWIARLSQTSTTGNDYIRALTVIGDKPVPTPNEKEISGGRKVTIDKAHVLNFAIDEANQVNHDFMRALECGGIFKVWYETEGGRLFGGNDGIEAKIKLDMLLGSGGELQKYQGAIEWDDKFTEEQVISPIAA